MEDIYFTYKTVACGSSFYHIPHKDYYYYQNNEGIMRSSRIMDYYMDVHYVFAAAVDMFADYNKFENLREELQFVYFKKVYQSLYKFLENVHDQAADENRGVLRQFMIDTFGDVADNQYMSEEDIRFWKDSQKV